MSKTPKISAVRRSNSMSPETRQKLSELAKKRYEEGSGFALSNPRSPEALAKAAATRRARKKKTASDWVAEAAEKHAAEITRVFKDAINPSQPMGTRLKAAQAWLEVERDNRKLEIQQEAAEAQQHSRDELIAILAEKLTAGPASDLLRKQLGDGVIVEGTAEDVIVETAS